MRGDGGASWILSLDDGLAAGGQACEYGHGARENQGWAGRSQGIHHRITKTQVHMGRPETSIIAETTFWR